MYYILDECLYLKQPAGINPDPPTCHVLVDNMLRNALYEFKYLAIIRPML